MPKATKTKKKKVTKTKAKPKTKVSAKPKVSTKPKAAPKKIIAPKGPVKISKTYEPKDTEKYMCEKHLVFFRMRLTEWKKI